MNNSQSNGIGLTSKVQTLLQDQLEHEKLCVDKYTEYADKAKDPQLSQLLTEIRDCEQKHYDTIQSMLNGTIPNVSGGNSGGGSTTTNSSSMSSGMSGSSNSSSMSGTTNSSGNSTSGTSYMNSTSGTTGTKYSGSTGSSSYTNSSSDTMSTGKSNSKNSYTNSKSSTKNHKNKSHSYNYPPQSTLTASTKDYNEKQPPTAQNPVTAANTIFSGYTGGGSMGSYINQADGNSLLRSYENTLHPDDLVIGSGGISYGSYGATDGGPTYNNSTSTTSSGSSYKSQTTNSTTNTTGTTSSNNTSSTNSTSSTSGSMGNSKSVTSCDQTMCQDLLMTEKHISKNYDTTIFECPNVQMRNVLNHIQKEEQEHGEKLYNYMHQKGWY